MSGLSGRVTALLLVAVGCNVFSFPLTPARDEAGNESGGAGGASASEAGSESGGAGSGGAASGAAGSSSAQAEGEPCGADGSCGVDAAGVPMTCFRGSALAGKDFCAASCGSAPASDPDRVCVAGALLHACHPRSTSDAADCPVGFNCYRTSLTENRGVCIQMRVCQDDGDCVGQFHRTCASTVIRQLGGDIAETAELDHLNCVKAGCFALGSACSGDESCLATQYDPKVADLCVPNCDANGQCPPNYSCIRTSLPNSVAELCMPAMPGVICQGDSCIAGECQDTGAGVSACSVSCQRTEDCQNFNSNYDQFFCVTNGNERHCENPRVFHGASCRSDEDCRQDLNEFCSKWLGSGSDPLPGNCRIRCAADGTCAPRGGLPHTCLGDGAGGCYPGVQGLPCHNSQECVAGLDCLDVPAEPDIGTAPARLCTQPCPTDDLTNGDAQCNKPAHINSNGYCGGGFCRGKQKAAERCSRDAQCMSETCDLQANRCL